MDFRSIERPRGAVRGLTALVLSMMLLSGGPAALAQAPFTGKPRYAIEARRAGTVLGTIHVELFPAIAPRAVNLWDSLTALHFFDSTAFHRVVPGFVVQGGDPNSRHGPRSTWGYGQPSQPNVPAEFSAVSFERGILGAARDNNPNSANSQFFICVAAARNLNGQYTAYGRVRGGMAVVDQIVSAPRDANDNPIQKIEMFITRVGSNDTVAVPPLLLAPADRAGGQPETPKLRWRTRPDALLYGVQLSPDSTFATGLLVDATLSQLDSSLTTPALQPITTYFWRVRSNNGGSQSAWSPTWRFRTGAVAPLLLAPANNAAAGVPTTPLLQWAPVPGATAYQVQVARSALFRANQIVFDQATLTTPQAQVTAAAGLAVGLRYYWRARAIVGTEPGFLSPIWNFQPTFVLAVAAERAAALALAPVAPNPVSEDGATLSFTLAAPGPASLTVLDLLGRPVAQLLPTTPLAAGTHAVRLAPGALAPGTYLLRLAAAGEQRTRRVVITTQ